MKYHLQKELDKIKEKLLTLGALVEDRVYKAVRSIESKDEVVAKKIIEADNEIDEMEIELEEDCLKVLALHQPVAVDLRFIIAVIKINNDLERVADQAVNIASRVANISKREKSEEFFHDYSLMEEKVEYMFVKSLDAFVNMDVSLAEKIIKMDDEVDKLKGEAYDIIKDAMIKRSDQIGYLINFFLISRHLERIADYATNIAEEVIYLVEGKIVRHRDEYLYKGKL
ncbi:MAG: phosphate signaling complex protein PhoU [Desulfobacterales bacterium]|nr:phosphate signaling complex protein PhoU [Desulfobacterales bacterium]MCP4162173.1 phosphate signaling complex protein PhoU [Deltaproteobacteria bacterium]